MTELTLSEILGWFRDLGTGWDLKFEQEGDTCWAHLQSLSNHEFVVPRYGSGSDELQAARRAKSRWEVEQIGSPNEGKPRYLP